MIRRRPHPSSSRRTRITSTVVLHTTRRMVFLSSLITALLLLLILTEPCRSQDATAYEADQDEYLREILQEERRLEEDYMRQHGGEPSNFKHYDSGSDEPYVDPVEQRMRDENIRRQAETERIAHEEAERVRRQREAEFEAELARMNEQQQKTAKRQKRKDARVVRRVLRAAQNERHYGVLGIRNWDLRIGPLTLLQTDAKAIKRAYRNRAMTVHPDKNRDGRANEAFIAVESSASILSDESLRDEYDAAVRLARTTRREEIKQLVSDGTDFARRIVGRVMWVFRRVLGPFATPIFILGCLLI